MGHTGGRSEFHELTVTNTSPIPLDLGGAKSATFTVFQDSIYIATNRTIPEGDRFLLMDMGGDGGGTANVQPFTIQSSDERLWLQAVASTARVYVWVVRA